MSSVGQSSKEATSELLQEQAHELRQEDLLVGLLIDGNFKVERFLRHESHSDVYSIRYVDGEVSNLEARAYILNDIPPKIRSHRLRNIKRLSNRTVVEVFDEETNKTIVVYKADNTETQNLEGKFDDSIPSLLPMGEKPNPKTTSGTKNHEKTEHQREAARVRQHERRRANRQKQKQLNSAANADTQDTKDSLEIQWETDDEETLYVLLHLANDGRSDLHEHLHPVPRAVLERYLSTQLIEFKDDTEMETFMMIKYREVLFLRRQLRKLPDVTRRRHDEFGKILREQAQLPRDSKEYAKMQHYVKMAQHRLKVIRHVHKILPDVINQADKTYRDLKDRLLLVREKKKEIEEMRSQIADKERLKREVNFCSMCSKEVAPGSGPYAQLVAQLMTAQAKLEKLALMNDVSVIGMEGLEKVYKELLAAPVEDHVTKIDTPSI